MKLTFLLAGILLAASQRTITAEIGSSNSVAVLDFSTENSGMDVGDWMVGLADYVELALQKENVPTLERRQIRLILGERDLQVRGVLAVDTLRAAKLPTVSYFIGGSVSRASSNEFALTFSIVRADTAIVESSLTRRGAYPADWLPAIESLAKEVSARLQIAKPEQPARCEFESLTWLPEAALPFFKGLEHYAHEDYAQAIPWFRHAYERDKHFDEARLWEARAYRQAGLPNLAEIVLKPVIKSEVAGKVAATKLPVTAVVASQGVSVTGRAILVQAMAQSGRFELFEPASIGATAREIDLQLTGQMAAPLNDRSIWLVIDSVIFLDVPEVGGLRARQCDLLSGKLIREVKLASPREPGDGTYLELATALLLSKPDEQFRSSREMESSMRDLSEPNSSDKPEVAFAKALRLVMAEPNRVRFLVGLADYYSEGGFRTALLDEAVAAIERDREQPDAAFWLASALWRKREMTRRVYHDPAPQYRAANALTNDFSRLLEWFPTSQEAHSLVEVTNRGEGNYTHVRAKYGRYLGAVFTNIVARPKPPVVAVAPVKAPAVTDAQRQARLDDYLRQGRTVLAWQVVNSIRTADDSSVQPQVRRVYDDLQEVVLREYREFKVFTNAVAQKESQRALDLGRTLLNCALRQQRLEVIEKCGELLKEAKGFPEQFEFVFAQAQRYRNDFLLDPVTGAPGVHIVFRIEGNPPVATRWTTYGFDYAYARVVGELVEAARARARPDLAAKIFEALRNDETLPLRNRLTAAYDLALMEHEQGRHFEALELLKEVLRETEGTGLPLARKESWSSERIETLAFDALRKIRLYTGAEVDVCGCCGEIPSVLPPKPANFEEMDRLLGELWKQTTGGVGADNRLVKQQLLERKGDFMPAILYKLRNDQEVSHMLIFCGQLGTNAAVALPVIVQFICHGERFQDYNNALSALGGIGKPAACAKPLLILAMEDSRSVFNAEYALKKVGPAPRRVMPYLAQLLHHKNAAICEQAARAMIETANMDKDAFAGKSGEPLVLALRQWWEAQGVKQAWSQK